MTKFSTTDEVSRRTATNAALQSRVIAHTSRNFDRFRNMGFFAPDALKAPRQDLGIDWSRLIARIGADCRMSLEILKACRESYERQMAFLEEHANDHLWDTGSRK